MAKREIKLDISQTSLNKFDALFKKFNIKWDEKVFKSTDKLSERIQKLNQSVMLWNKKIEESRLRTANQAIKDFDAGTKGKGVSGQIPEFDTSKLEGSFERLAKAIEDATEKMEDMEKGTEDISSLTFDQRRTIIDDIKQRELGRLQVMADMKVKQQANRKEMENLHAKHQQEKKALGSWEESLGSAGGLLKTFFSQGDEMMKPFTDLGKYQEYMKTGEGQAEMLNYEKAGMGGNPMAQVEAADKMRSGGGFGGNVGALKEKSSGFMGKMQGKMGSMFGMGKEGGMGGIMKGLGGAKGMMMLGGAMAGIKIIQKGVQLAIASSPMMQQMLKLWKFGIMMIFRPIGDFFGFFLRPIFVYLLRKFIIPFYQTYLPLMQELGQTLGEGVVGWLESIFGVLNIITGHEEPISGLLEGVQGSVDAINPQLLSDTELITAAIDKSKINTKDLMGNWEKFAEQLFPNQDVKGYDIGGIDDVRKNIPLTEAAAQYYRDLGVEVIPHLEKGSGRFDSATTTFSTATQQFADTVADIKAGEAGNQGVGSEDPRSKTKTIIVIDQGGNSSVISGEEPTPEDKDKIDDAVEESRYASGRWS